MKKRYAALTALLLMAAVLMPATAKAAVTKSKTVTLKKGQVVYVVDTNISKNKITGNSFSVTPTSTKSYYDMVFVFGTKAKPSVRALVNTNFKYTSSSKVTAYMKESANANTGALVALRVRSGSVKLKVSSTRASGGFKLKFQKRTDTKTILRMTDVEKGRQIQFTMADGNVSIMPLIFGGTSGTKIRRRLNDTRYELYTFGDKNMTRKTYQDKKVVSSQTIKYNSIYTDTSGRKFYFVVIPVPASATLRVSGWMTTTKGMARYFYPKEYLGFSYDMK